jgi:hypothetical protein
MWSQVWRFTPVIPAILEAEIGEPLNETHPGQKHETISEK